MEKKPPIPPRQKPVLEDNSEKLKQEKEPKVVENSEQIPEEQEAEGKKRKKFKLNKKVILWGSIGLGVVILAIVAIIVFSPKYEKMQAPSVIVYTLSNQTIVYVDENKDAVRYDFYIQKQGETSITSISSNTNSVSIVSKLKSPGQYTIWARYAGQNVKQNSDESKKYTYVYTKQLNSPSVNLNQGKLIWEKDTEASSYRLFYGADEEGALYFSVPQAPSNKSNVEFDLGAEMENLPAGRYSLHVQAVASSSGYYTDSTLGQEISYVNIKSLKEVLTASFNKTTNMLTFTSLK